VSNDNAQETTSVRPLALRIIFGVLWFVPIYLVVQIAVGAIVGALASAGTTSYEEGFAAGQAASIAFFQRFGGLVLAFEVILTIVLSWFGILPGTAKYKR